MRDFVLMRKVLAEAHGHTQGYNTMAFFNLGESEVVEAELKRLSSDGLLDADIEFDRFGTCVNCKVGGLTDEGTSFYRLVENHDVWRVVDNTLEAAGVDVSYPLLKEVCEEIVKRYVTSFIPDI